MIFRRCTARRALDLPEVSKMLAEKSRRLWLEEEEVIKRMTEKFERALEERKHRRDFFRYWGSEEQEYSFSVKSWRGEIPRVTALSDSQQEKRKLGYLEECEPSSFFQEVRDERKRPAPDVRSREDDERLPGDDPRPARKKAKRGSSGSKKPIPGPVWEEECELKLNNSISDSELLG